MIDALSALRDFSGRLRMMDMADERVRYEASFEEFFRLAYPAYQVKDFHRHWVRHIKKNPFSLLLAPRGSSKSTMLTVAYAAWRALKNPDTRILISSATAFMAKRMLREIKAIMGSGPIQEIWGNVRGAKWTDNEIELGGRSGRYKEATITALGSGESIISGHYDVVIADDIVNEDWCRSALLRDKIWDWFRNSLLPVIEPGGELHVYGTRYHYDDIYGRLQSREYTPLEFPTLIGRAILDSGESFWPERFSLEVLERWRKLMGSIIFAAQFQNDALAMLGKIFKPAWIQRYQRLPSSYYQTQGVDLAIGEKQTSDYFAHVTIALDSRRNVYVLNAYHDRITFDQQFTKVKELYELQHKSSRPVTRVGIESNAYQAALAQKIRLETGIPVREVHQHRDKVVRAQWAQPWFENHKVFFPPAGTEELEMEILTFDEGPHDDLLDALIIAMMMAGVIGRKRKGGYRSLPAALR